MTDTNTPEFEPGPMQPTVTRLELTVPTVQARRWAAAAKVQSQRLGAEVTLEAFMMQSCDHGAALVAAKVEAGLREQAEATMQNGSGPTETAESYREASQQGEQSE